MSRLNIYPPAGRRIARWLLAGLWVVVLAAGVAAKPAESTATQRILVLGDSISAAYGIDTDAGWVQLLQAPPGTANRERRE